MRAAGLVGTVGAAAAVSLTTRVGQVLTERLVTALDVVAIGMFLAAGVLRTARWRLHGDPADALVGSALVVLGVGLLPVLRHELGHAAGGAAEVPAEQVATGLATVVVVAIFARALLQPAGARPRPLPLVVGATVLVAGGSLCAVVILDRLPGSEPFGAAAASTTLCATATAWVLLAALAAHRRRRCPWAGRAVLPLGGLGVADALHAAAHAVPAVADPLTAAAALLAAAAAATATHHALVDLEIVVDTEQAALETELRAATAAVAERDAWREELGHDATNALAGLRSALSTLERYADELDPITVARLQHAAMAEIGHVEHLLQREGDDPVVDVHVGEVVCDVVGARRATGSRVQLARLDGAAQGRPGDLATVLHNLLLNVARHAPGARAVIDVEQRPGRVEVHVVDDGPGMTDALAARAFDRGVHGGHHRSTGLGLFISRQLMREMGGDLELRGHAAGCHLVASLPTADVPVPPVPVRPIVDVHQLLRTVR